MNKRPQCVLDIECYVNFFSIGVKSIGSGKSKIFERSQWQDFEVADLKKLLNQYTIITFNGNRYDMLLLKLAIAGGTNEQLKKLSDDIIVHELKSWDAERKYSLPECKYIDHVDLIEVAPGKASLKIYGGRLHSKRMQDLPIEPSARITAQQREILNTYLINDLDTTIDLFNRLKAQVELREKMSQEYGLDLRSKSDAQIAEAVIKKQIEKVKGERVFRPDLPSDYSFNYVPPDYIRFKLPQLQSALRVFSTEPFGLNAKGDVAEPAAVGALKVRVGKTDYQLGIGGIHSCEKCVHYVADENHLLIDRDVTSYYPNIILNQQLYPKHIGKEFLTVYKAIVDRRVKAKREGDKVTNEALKVTINGSFGKFGSKWSALYGPNLLIQTTVTGQLSLLMLIEALECAGIEVVSANTDGIVIYCHTRNQAALDSIITDWEAKTGFQTEETRYSALYSRDINNYLALKADGSYKAKGTYADENLSKTPTAQICVQAVVDWLQLGVPIEQTVASCQDVRKFISVRAVTGGAVKGNEYLGKAVRWYYAKGETGAIHYKKNGNKVATTDGAKPLMVLPDRLPSDIDLDWYVQKARATLKDFGLS